MSFKLDSVADFDELKSLIDIANSCGIEVLAIKKGRAAGVNSKTSSVLEYFMKSDVYKDVTIIIHDLAAFKTRVNAFGEIYKVQADDTKFTITGTVDEETTAVRSLSFSIKDANIKMSHVCGSISAAKRIPIQMLAEDLLLASYELTQVDKNIIKSGINSYKSEVVTITSSGVEVNLLIRDQNNKFDYSMYLDEALAEDNKISVDTNMFKTVYQHSSLMRIYTTAVEFVINGVHVFITNSLKA